MAEQGPLSGQILGGKYLVGELLGEGGFGMVYAGQHRQLKRPQAIKFLLEHYFRQPKFRERFLKEAQIVAVLEHEHIVHIDDFEMEEQPAGAYIVMQFIGGGSLHALLEEARKQQRLLDMERLVSYLEQISSALDYAHQLGVVHLDLKPQNLLVHNDGRLLLADFGLAHLIEEERLVGGTSLKYGTPHYMAPEQIQGHPKKQSDVYALGVILYQMLVGRRPFEGMGLEVISKKLLREAPPLQQWRPELPMELEKVLQTALAQEVAQRYQSAGELLEAFKNALAHARKRVRKAEEEQTRKTKEQASSVPPRGASTNVATPPDPMSLPHRWVSSTSHAAYPAPIAAYPAPTPSPMPRSENRADLYPTPSPSAGGISRGQSPAPSLPVVGKGQIQIPSTRGQPLSRLGSFMSTAKEILEWVIGVLGGIISFLIPWGWGGVFDVLGVSISLGVWQKNWWIFWGSYLCSVILFNWGENRYVDDRVRYMIIVIFALTWSLIGWLIGASLAGIFPATSAVVITAGSLNTNLGLVLEGLLAAIGFLSGFFVTERNYSLRVR